jgi:hypothetical protein
MYGKVFVHKATDQGESIALRYVHEAAGYQMLVVGHHWRN